MKAEGKSLRQIAAVLGISHVAVLKKLRAIEAKKQVVTSKGKQALLLKVGEKEVEFSSIPHKSRVCGESGDAGNQAVTKQTPSLDKDGGGNPSGNPFQSHSEWSESGVSNGIDDLFETIKGFLESHGISIYRMKVSGEAFQVRYGQQTIRFYVDRKRYNPVGGEPD